VSRGEGRGMAGMVATSRVRRVQASPVSAMASTER
jgi:hypothetical protein